MINEKQSKNYRDISYLYKKEDYCISDSNTFISQKIEEIIAKKEISINPNDLRDIRKEKIINIIFNDNFFNVYNRDILSESMELIEKVEKSDNSNLKFKYKINELDKEYDKTFFIITTYRYLQKKEFDVYDNFDSGYIYVYSQKLHKFIAHYYEYNFHFETRFYLSLDGIEWIDEDGC